MEEAAEVECGVFSLRCHEILHPPSNQEFRKRKACCLDTFHRLLVPLLRRHILGTVTRYNATKETHITTTVV